MVKKFVALFGLVTLLAALPAASLAQDAKTFLGAVAKAMGAENLKTIEYSGAGSTAALGQPLERVKSYKREMDLNASASRVQLVRVHNDADQPQTLQIAASSPWDTQYDFWITPYGFLKGAMTHEATMKPETVLGEKYNAVSFMVQEKYRVTGYINQQNMVEKVETRIGNDVLARGVYLHYQDFGGLKFPTTIIQQQNGENALILIVDNVKANAPVMGN